MLKIVADENIPGIGRLLGDVGEITMIPGARISAECVRDADILLVRSVTRVNEALLEGTAVRFVGTATAGVDHIDTEYLSVRKIAFASAPGSNAPSVVDYVLSAVVVMALARELTVGNLCFGIIGFGHVGSRLAARLSAAGIRVVVNDPPLEATSPGFSGQLPVLPLHRLLQETDIVSLHVPLVSDGAHATAGLVGTSELERLGPDSILINTSRGAVVDGARLRDNIMSGWSGAAVLDVFENEPEPDRQLIASATIATPHIAGYAIDSKLEGARMVAAAVRKYLGHEEERTRAETDPKLQLTPPDAGLAQNEWLQQLVLQMYDIQADSRALKRAAAQDEDLAAAFLSMRTHYSKRRTFDRFLLERRLVPEAHRQIARAIGFHLAGPY